MYALATLLYMSHLRITNLIHTNTPIFSRFSASEISKRSQFLIGYFIIRQNSDPSHSRHLLDIRPFVKRFVYNLI